VPVPAGDIVDLIEPLARAAGQLAISDARRGRSTQDPAEGVE
jgi:hypothetical protein